MQIRHCDCRDVIRIAHRFVNTTALLGVIMIMALTDHLARISQR